MLRGDNSERYGWLIGGGIISFSAAVYMIRNGNMQGENIHIFEEVNRSAWKNELSEKESIFIAPLADYKPYTNLLDLLSEIPSVANPKLSAKDELLHFNKEIPNLLKGGKEENQQTLLNQYHTCLLSLREWIKSRGVVFYQDATVHKLEFKKYADTDEQVITGIEYKQDSEKEILKTGFEDIIIIGTEYLANKIPEKCHNLAYFHLSPDQTATIEEVISKTRKTVYTLLGVD